MKIQWSDFRAFSDNNLDDIPTKAGVYLLWMKIAREDWRLFYVGEADSLLHTLKRHLSCQETNFEIRRKLRNCVTGFEYSVQPDPEVRSGVLKFLTEQCRPELPCPAVRVEAEPISVNLP
jgi:excinuclease UvrABC nuclease subunit